MDKEEQIRNVADRLIHHGDVESIETFFTNEYKAHAEDKEYHGHGFLEKYTRQIRQAIPDIRVTRIKIFLQEGDTIAWQRSMQGTHKSDLMGIPSSGRRVSWNEMVISRFDDEKIAEEWVISELAGQLLLKQPGIKPKSAGYAGRIT